MPRDGDEMDAIAHYDVLSLADNLKACFFKCPNRTAMD